MHSHARRVPQPQQAGHAVGLCLASWIIIMIITIIIMIITIIVIITITIIIMVITWMPPDILRLHEAPGLEGIALVGVIDQRDIPDQG